MASVLVDSNVPLDALSPQSAWGAWSEAAIAAAADRGRLIINTIIYAEVSVGYVRIEDLDDALPADVFVREPLPYEAGFLAYRRRGGARTSPLPDFFIGAHAAVAGYALLTRDARRYRTYFPKLELLTPG